MSNVKPEAMRLADAMGAVNTNNADSLLVQTAARSAAAELRRLHTENTALRVTEDNLRQELQECQDQRRAAFRRIEELEAMRAQSNDNWQQYATEREDTAQAVIERHRREIKSLLNLLAKDRGELQALRAQIGQGVPVAWKWKNKNTKSEGVYLEDPREVGINMLHPDFEWASLYTHPAPHQKPLTDEQITAGAKEMSKLPPLPHWCEPGSPFAEQMQAYATAATAPLLQRIAELEQRNSDLHEDVQRFKKHALNEKAARLELERQLEEALQIFAQVY